jgi:hypothetical protein
MKSPCCLCVCMPMCLYDCATVCLSALPLINFWMPEPIFMKLAMYDYIMVPGPVSVSLCVYMYNVTARKNTYATTEELLKASFSVRSVSYQMKIGN